MTVQQAVGHVCLDRAVAHAFVDFFIAIAVGTAFRENVAREHDVLAVRRPFGIANARVEMSQLCRFSPGKRKKPGLRSFMASRKKEERCSVGRPPGMIIGRSVIRQLPEIVPVGFY